MKNISDNEGSPALGLELVPVRFEYTHPTAASVAVAGSFNGWQPEAKQLHHAGVGLWWKETVLPPGTYEYCFIVDSVWIPDPRAPHTVPNPYGGANSILRVEQGPLSDKQEAALAAARKKAKTKGKA